MEIARRPDLEAIVAERLKAHSMPPELIVAFSQMLSEWELHWWESGQKAAVSKIREALAL